MNLLYLVSNRRHTHDFGVDYLYSGLRAVLGADRVYCWPEVESLHEVENPTLCETCEQVPYESDQKWPRRGYSLEDAMRVCDVALIATQSRDLQMEATHNALRKEWKNKPVAAYDSGDAVSSSGDGMDLLAYYRWLAGRPLTAFFKRELPLGATWALPLPLSYPCFRVEPGSVTKDLFLVYLASEHDVVAGAGAPRLQIVTDCRFRFRERTGWDARLYGKGETKLDPREYRQLLRRALLGVSWNGAPYVANWDCNRVWEQFAYGMAQVVQRPTIQIPHAPVDGVHWVLVDSVDEVGVKLQELWDDPPRALKIAAAGHQHWVQYHCSEARAGYVLKILELLG